MAVAAQLPSPRAVFFGANGNLLAGGYVWTYAPNTTTPKTTWQDAAQTTPNANPILLDSAGSCLLYGNGIYTLSVLDSLGNAVPGYSGLTTAPIPTSATLAALLQGYISGLTLSNDGSTPNTVLDIAAGTCTDSTASVSIQLGAFTKSTAGAWAAGTGSNGMGQGLTIANFTWYHVFAIVNNGAADVYFDTSVSAANKPANTTAFRRIGSFLTDGSAHIRAFTQFSDRFIWGTAAQDVNNDTTLSNTKKSYTLGSLPPGVNPVALLRISAANSSTVTFFTFGSPAESTFVGASLTCNVAAVSNAGEFEIVANTSQQIAALASQAANNTVTISTVGWIDPLGRLS